MNKFNGFCYRDEITQEWDAKKQDLTNEFKRKYKSEGKAKKRSHRN